MIITQSEAETIGFGLEFASHLFPGDIVALHGELGAGKTTLIKGIIQGLVGSHTRDISSPTFTYMNLYQGPVTVFHFDLYRLKEEAEFLQMGFLDFLEQGGVSLIEWPSRIPSILPSQTVHVTLETENPSTRRIHVQNR